ncbi:TraR/DksA C4-type zinc finger protein [Chitinophaga pendula]|uniref:TraR/DksA C4-type zinc finger protein n=1 Tax=Chitinophaga TaxID=79328 RepID=UPI0012FE6E9F|nr:MULTISPECIES: TraR/DksA C4-type zinc finger protein [Chitinophaga]UCJ07047.1 TraR/DksA C4-type zinc finger protein [Chitinophaga pendula]
MATKKKVASKKAQKAVPEKKTAAQKPTAAKINAKPVAKKEVVAPKKVTAKKAVPKAAAKPVTKQVPVAKKAVGKAAVTSAKAPVAKAGTSAQRPGAKQVPAPQVMKKAVKPVASVKTIEKKSPIVKEKAATRAIPAEREKPFPKTEEKEVKTMPVKNKAEKEKAVAKEAGKKVTAEKTEKVEKAVKAEKAERAEKKGAKSTAVVSYQPEFTKSVLDQPDQPTGPIYRYSDVELQEFRELIQKKLEAAKKELVYLQGLITRKDEAGTDDTENKYMSMEDGSGSQEREQLNQMASRQIQFIDHLEKAMVRIENKTYGICRVTGKLIDKARLRAVPHATLSIEAKLAKSK